MEHHLAERIRRRLKEEVIPPLVGKISVEEWQQLPPDEFRKRVAGLIEASYQGLLWYIRGADDLAKKAVVYMAHALDETSARESTLRSRLSRADRNLLAQIRRWREEGFTLEQIDALRGRSLGTTATFLYRHRKRNRSSE